MEIVVHLLRLRLLLERGDGPVHGVAHLLAALGPDRGHVIGRQQIGHVEVLVGRVGVEDERVILPAEVAGGVAVGQVAAGAADGPRHKHVPRHLAALALEVRQHATGVRVLDAAGEQPAGLHHLVAGVMHGRRRVVNAAHERKLVGVFGRLGKHLANAECPEHWWRSA